MTWNPTRLGLCLVHDKGRANRAQIDALALHVYRQDIVTGELDAEGEPIILRPWGIVGVAQDHEARFWQAVPVGVVRPLNMGALDSHNCIYAPDPWVEDTPATYWNWCVKSAFDAGAGLVALVLDHTQLDTLAAGVLVPGLHPWGLVLTLETFKRAAAVTVPRGQGVRRELFARERSVVEEVERVIRG